MSQHFLNLADRDFDAYLSEKATSNAYSRPRLEVKQRALAWARRVVARLAELGIAVDVHGSDECPSLRNKRRVDCQWVFLWRDSSAREELERLLDQGRPISAVIDDPSPYTRHAFLALRIDSRAVEVCFAVHPDAKVDVDNLQARLASSPQAEGGARSSLADEFSEALRTLPEQFALGAGTERVTTQTATLDTIVNMLERAADGQVPLWIGWSVPRDVALEHAEILDEQLEDALVALAPIYRLVAWSRDNDHILLDRRLEGIERERARTHAEAEAQNEKWRAEQAAARERSLAQARVRQSEADRRVPLPGHPIKAPFSPRGRPTLETLFKSGEGTDKHSAPAAGKSSTESRPQRSHVPSVQTAASPIAAEKSSVLEKGAKVWVRSGPFADKVGTISELDGRGGARVLLGLLSTRLELTDLEPFVEGRERPQLQSSHRRPLPPLPRKIR